MNKLAGSSKGIQVLLVGLIVILTVALFSVGYMLSNRLDTLQTNYNKLETDYQSLQTSYNQLQSSANNNTNLQAQYNQLQVQCNQISSQYQQLLSKLPSSGEALTIDSIDCQSRYITPSGIYNVTLRNHVSSEIHVTALKIYSGSTLSSSAAVLVTIPANSAYTISHYIAWGNAALTESSTITLKIETLEGYNVISDPLSV